MRNSFISIVVLAGLVWLAASPKAAVISRRMNSIRLTNLFTLAATSLQSEKTWSNHSKKSFLSLKQGIRGCCHRFEGLYAAIVFAVVCLCLTSNTVAQSQLPREQSLADLARYQNQLEELEQQYDRYDPRLVETLGEVGKLMIELDQYDQADEILDRAILILRISEGLYTETQFPYLLLSAEGDVRRSNWRDANEKLSHIAALHEFEPRVWNSEFVSEIVKLGELHLEGVVTDSSSNQAYHLRAIERISWEAKNVGETIWSDSDRRLLDLYYRIVIHNYLKSLINNRGGEQAESLRQFIPGLSMMKRSRLELNRVYYRVGIEMFRRMRQVFEASSPADLQGVAMVDLYQADWQVLFNEGNLAEAYLKAYRRLLEAGIGDADIKQLFNRPQILPVMEFYPTIQMARQANLSENYYVKKANNQPTSTFQEWSPELPYIQVPQYEPLFPQQELEEMYIAQVAFRLEGVRRMGRWIRGRYVRKSSVPRDIHWLNQSSIGNLSMDDLVERLHHVHFRPVLDQGVPQPYEGTLEYRYFPVDRE